MRSPRSTVFLERQTYRRRRLIDWIKVLPVIGMILWLVPLLWRVDGPNQISSSTAIIYVFAIWFVLVVAKALSARALKGVSAADLEDTDRGEHG